jgi:hypothetical protein
MPLIWGTANPVGLDARNSIYLTRDDIKTMVKQITDANVSGKQIPVHVEHKGIAVGHVVSAWEHAGALQCVLHMNDRVLEGAMGTELVRHGIVKDLSLGYDVSLAHTASTGGANNGAQGVHVTKKHLREISIVISGARAHCHIHAVT